MLLTSEATLQLAVWGIYCLQIKLSSCTCLYMTVFVASHTPMYRRDNFYCMGAVANVAAIINSVIKCSHLRSQVQVCFLPPPAVMRQQHSRLCRLSLPKQRVQSLGCVVSPPFYGLFLLLVYFGLPQPC